MSTFEADMAFTYGTHIQADMAFTYGIHIQTDMAYTYGVQIRGRHDVKIIRTRSEVTKCCTQKCIKIFEVQDSNISLKIPISYSINRVQVRRRVRAIPSSKILLLARRKGI